MVAVREWGTWIRRETRHLYSGKPDSIEKHLFAAGRADAAYLEVIRLVRGEKAAEALEAAVMLREDVTESRRTS
jgi:hypothetical protein